MPITDGHDLSDTDVLDRAAEVVSVPRNEEGDSFILHAPLELLARSALLTVTGPDARDAIRDRLAAIADTYRAWGTPIERQPVHAEAVTADPTGVLVAALGGGDLDGADDAITWLAGRLDTGELVRLLTGLVLPSLAAAAHGPILLYLLPRVAARSLPAASMARTTIHELGRHPDWTLTWIDGLGDRSAAPDAPTDPGAELSRRLIEPELTRRPDNTFIFPTMAAVDRSGLAVELLGGLVPHLDVGTARRSLLALAAQSMLQDDADHAPYGWSHCLTMPQAALGIAGHGDDRLAMAVAATYVLGFRATLGSVAVDPDRIPEPVDLAPGELLDAGPDRAAAAAWHAGPDDHGALWRTLAGHAGAHADAHLAKYTLACLDATRADPDRADLFRAAAAYLNAWWVERGGG